MFKEYTVIRADEDVPVFVVISDAATSDHVLLSQMPIPSGSCITFDMGYVDYEAWQKFADDDITYVTREKKKCRYKVLEAREIPEVSKNVIVSDEIVELSWTRRWERPHDRGGAEPQTWPQAEMRGGNGQGETVRQAQVPQDHQMEGQQGGRLYHIHYQ